MKQRKPLSAEKIEILRSKIRPLMDAFDLIHDHVVITDADGNILYANEGVERITGYTSAEMIGKTPGDLWGGVMEKKVFEDMWKKIKTDKIPFEGEVQNKNKNGQLYWQELRICPVLDNESKPKFFIGIEPDITVRKVFEKNREQYIKELERLNTYMKEKELRVAELIKIASELKNRMQIKKV